MTCRLGVAAFALVALMSGGCGPTKPAADASGAGARSSPVHPVAVNDRDFAPRVYELVVNGGRTPERTNLLAGVVRHQLARAERRFNVGQTEAGLAALRGALFLVRAGEFDPTMVSPRSNALLAAAAEVSRVGNEGQAVALYRMLERVLPAGAARRDVEHHLKALSNWNATTKSSGPMQAAGADQRASVQRSLIEPSREALDQARNKTTAWVQRALASDIAELPIRTSFERDEAIEAYRALRAGGATLVALYLRHGDARGAIEAIDKGDLGRVVPPGLRERLERAAEDDDPGAWTDLFRLFDSADQAERPETSLDPMLATAASWGAALELFRSEPSSMRGASPLSVLLVDHGMAEVAPLVLAVGLGKQPSAQDLSWALSLVLRAVVGEEQIGDVDAARRAFESATPILTLADAPPKVGRIRPSAARLRYVMGALEMRGGNLPRARPLIEAASRAEPTLEAYMSLAAVDRQRNPVLALRALDSAVEFAKKQDDLAAQAEADVLRFEIFRDQSKAAEARPALQRALERILDARQKARSLPAQARAERLLARVLEHYGEVQGARRATQRAYDLSTSDARQLTATVLDASRRALTRRDLPAAREAVQKAIEAGLADEDIVYAALWLKLLERQLDVTSDGTTEEAFATIDDTSGWPAKLRAWGRGKLNDQELLESARDRVQRTEAMFYTAMAKHAAGQSDVALPKLREVAHSDAIELVEVTIARDLLAQHKGPALDIELPKNVDLP